MFFKRKFMGRKNKLINNTPLGSCEPSSCNSCSVSGCHGSTNKKELHPDSKAISDTPSNKNQIKHLIAIASGKGGVGKSTVTSNLAYALKELGFTVGILDADIYGPSQATMLGESNATPTAFDSMIRPITKNGIKFISMANLSKNTPTIWRAPIAIQALEQFLHGVYWGELDYLLIDLPPGTGDIQITLAQQAKLSGAIIVSTPQKVAANVAHNGLKMFQQVNVPILGIVENMANFSCSKCHKNSKLYKGQHLSEIARKEKTTILTSIPLDAEIMNACDEGKSVFEYGLKNKSKSESLTRFVELAQKLTQECLISYEIKVNAFRLATTGELELKWHDGLQTLHKPYLLRSECKCALCVDEISGQQLIDPKNIDKNIKVTQIEPVGLYGLCFTFSDGHNSGIYALDGLR